MSANTKEVTCSIKNRIEKIVTSGDSKESSELIEKKTAWSNHSKPVITPDCL